MRSRPGDTVADELYGLPPEQFVAARDAAARAARTAGDRDAARAVAALRRPTVSAWLVNLLMRDDLDLGPRLLALGAALQDASASLDGPALRDQTRQRRALVSALVAHARDLAGRTLGDAVTRELDATLSAALADPDVGAEVTSGRLTGPREHIGMGFAPLPAAGDGTAPASSSRPAVPPDPPAAPEGSRPRLRVVTDEPARGPRPSQADDRQEGAARARQAEAARRRAVWQEARAEATAARGRAETAAARAQEARRDLDRARAAATAADDAADELRRAVDDLRRRLHDCESAAGSAHDEAHRAGAQLRRAEQEADDLAAAADRARDAQERARAALDEP